MNQDDILEDVLEEPLKKKKQVAQEGQQENKQFVTSKEIEIIFQKEMGDESVTEGVSNGGGGGGEGTEEGTTVVPSVPSPIIRTEDAVFSFNNAWWLIVLLILLVVGRKMYRAMPKYIYRNEIKKATKKLALTPEIVRSLEELYSTYPDACTHCDASGQNPEFTMGSDVEEECPRCYHRGLDPYDTNKKMKVTKEGYKISPIHGVDPYYRGDNLPGGRILFLREEVGHD